MALSAHWTYGVVDSRAALTVVLLHEVSASKASALAGLVRGRGRPPQAAARRAGLEFVEKLLPTKLTSTDTTERNAGMLRVPLVASLVELATDPGSSSP